MRVLITSANMGGVESNKFVPQSGNHTVDFVCYNDANFPTRQASFTPRMNAKIPKMLSWMLRPGYDLYIWVDFYFNVQHPGVADWFAENIKGHDALFFRHPWRSSVMDEARFIDGISNANDPIKLKVKGERLVDQVNRYLSDSDFKDDRLFSCGCFAYTNNFIASRNDNPMKEWFFQTATGSIRDQLSLPWVLNQFNCDYIVSEINIHNWELIK